METDLFISFEKMKCWFYYYPKFNYTYVIDKYNNYNNKKYEKFIKRKSKISDKNLLSKSLQKT